MSRTLSALIGFGLLLLVAGCPEEVGAPPPDDEVGEAPVCLQGEPFVADGKIPLAPREAGDARRISDLRWDDHDACERFVIDLSTDDETAAVSAGRVDAEVMRDLGVVRVKLRDVEWVTPEASDRSFGGRLTRAAYSVWSPDGRWTYVDLHLASEAEAHVAVLDEPARVVVDLRPGGGPIPESPATEQRIVVLEPRPGPASYPLAVTGYSRTFEANVVIRLEQNGEDVLEDFTTATAWLDAWGHYSFNIEEGPDGPVTLHVGEYSAKDGTWEGVAIELQMSSAP